jgi:tRNA pseudouridine synthase 10
MHIFYVLFLLLDISAGRYNKYSRELSQTPWLVEGERRIESSVQEFISKPLEEFCTSKG